MNIKQARAAAWAHLRRDLGDDFGWYETETLNEWVDDLLLEWDQDLANEIEQFGAPYHLAMPS